MLRLPDFRQAHRDFTRRADEVGPFVLIALTLVALNYWLNLHR